MILETLTVLLTIFAIYGVWLSIRTEKPSFMQTLYHLQMIITPSFILLSWRIPSFLNSLVIAVASSCLLAVSVINFFENEKG